jgi:two-component system, LytTR family, sensor kinase
MSGLLRRCAAAFAGFTALGLFMATANSLTYMSMGNPANWTRSVKSSLSEWWGWACLTPLVLWLAERWPISKPRALRNGALHLAAMFAVGIAKLLIDRKVRQWLFGAGYLLVSNLAFNFLLYWAVVAAAHGLSYYRSSRARELRASQLEARLADARLQLLSMQLQPHFLFNTLNAISELVHEDPEKADQMISGLSVLLRETLDAGREVPLSRELQLLGCYVDIQRARFGERLQLVQQIDGGAVDARVPALLLQPLVENAIRHGIGARAGAGCVAVSARRWDNRILLEVADDGAGLASDGVERTGIGLSNTRARLDAMFGTAFTLDVADAANGGVKVSISIPFRTRDQG